MRILMLLTVAAVVALSSPNFATAKPAGSIDCAMAAISASDQARFGAALAGSDREAVAPVLQALTRAAGPCIKANRWSDDQISAATNWMTWRLLSDEVARQVGLAPADATILRVYVDEDPRRITGLDGFSDAQSAQLIGELRKRGAHVHDGGKERQGELYVMYLEGEMKAEQGKFAAS